MKVYIATPINNRPEPTMERRLAAACLRVSEIKAICRKKESIFGPEPVLVSTFDVNPMTEGVTEAEAMGRCVSLLLTCDVIVVDNYNPERTGLSKGVTAETLVAKIYNKKVLYLRDEKEVKPKMDGGAN